MRRVLEWLPALTAAAYLGVAAATGPSIARQLGWDTDVSSRLVLADRLRGHGTVFIPHFGGWTSLWFELGTRGLPGHRALWEAAGYAFAVVGAAVLAWATAHVAGTWAGVTAFAVTLIVGPLALRSFFTLAYHVSTPYIAIVLGAFLVLLERRAALLLAVPVGILAGVNVASDPLLLPAGVVPFLIGGVLLARSTHRTEVAIRTGLTVALAIAAAISTSALMHGLGYRVTDAGAHLASVRDLPGHVLLLGRMVALLGGANYATAHAYPSEPLRAVVALLVLAAAVAPTIVAVRFLRSRARPMRRAYACYWAASTLLLGIAFVVTTNAGALGAGSMNYILTVAPAGAAGVALVASASARARVATGVAVALVGSTNMAGVIDGRAGTPRGEIGSNERSVVALLADRHVTRGYAGYWDAQNLTWQSKQRVLVAPVQACASSGKPLCPYRSSVIQSWYDPRPGPTFLLVDPTTGFVTSPPAFARRAGAVYRFGKLSVYVFPYDIARYVDGRG